MAIYIYIDNKPIGPFEEARILEWLAAGKLSYEDLAIRHGATEWTTLGEMFPSVSVPPDAMPVMPSVQFPPPMPPAMLPAMQPVMPPPTPLPAMPPIMPPVTPPSTPPVMQQPLQDLSGNGFSPIDVAAVQVEKKAEALVAVPEPKNGDYDSVILILGLAGLFVAGVIGVAAIFALSQMPRKVEPDNTSKTNTNSSNSSTNTKTTSFKTLTDKSKELAKLTPPVKLDSKPVLKEKIALVRQSDTRIENSISMQGYKSDNETYDDYDLKNFGLTPERLAKTPEEIETLIQTLCSKGRKIGTYSSRYGLIPAYSNICKVSIIDYKESKIIAQKSFENRKLQDMTTVYPNTSEDVAAIPYTEIEKYISDLSKNRNESDSRKNLAGK